MLAALTKISHYIIPLLLLAIPLYGLIKKVPVYETFVEGAKAGVKTALQIFPFILGILLAIAIFRASGAFEIVIAVVSPFLKPWSIPAEVLPLGLMRPLSGSGALGMTADILTYYGPDSLIGRMASVVQGSTDTTFYILAVYFGSVAIKKYRYALLVGLSADCVSFFIACSVCNFFF
ncbi:MAG: spore maturation protein [Bacillota bacterium]|jgi:spore maturation protein B